MFVKDSTMRNYILIVFQQARFHLQLKTHNLNKFTCTAKFRYRQPDTEVEVEVLEDNKVKEEMMQDLEKYFLSEKIVKYVMATGTKGFCSKPKTDLEIARPLLKTMR